MEIRKSTLNDIADMVKIYQSARKAMAEMGLDQWQGETPNADTALEDIKNGYSVVCTDNGEVVATAAIYVGDEITYKKMDTGAWLVDSEIYGIVHRIAVSPTQKRKGLAIKLMEYAQKITIESGVKSIRCDTHKDNIPMQNTMKKFGFEYCGEITILDGTSRVAFEKVV